jgi:hypothetical protein
LNKIERNYLFELYNNSNFVPNIKNNMDIGAATSQRYDLMEQSKLIKSLSYAILMLGSEDDKEYWKEECDEALHELMEFRKHREEENWNPRTTYGYTVNLSGW